MYITFKIRANKRNRARIILRLHFNDLNAAAVVGVFVAAAVVAAAVYSVFMYINCNIKYVVYKAFRRVQYIMYINCNSKY